jgi:hypothetical protein
MKKEDYLSKLVLAFTDSNLFNVVHVNWLTYLLYLGRREQFSYGDGIAAGCAS